MMFKKLLCLCVLLSLVGIASAVPVPVTIVNGGFEAPVNPGGLGTVYVTTPTGWTSTYNDGSSGLHTPTAGDTQSGLPAAETAAEGNQTLFGSNYGIELNQLLSETITANTIYELTSQWWYSAQTDYHDAYGPAIALIANDGSTSTVISTNLVYDSMGIASWPW